MAEPFPSVPLGYGIISLTLFGKRQIWTASGGLLRPTYSGSGLGVNQIWHFTKRPWTLWQWKRRYINVYFIHSFIQKAKPLAKTDLIIIYLSHYFYFFTQKWGHYQKKHTRKYHPHSVVIITYHPITVYHCLATISPTPAPSARCPLCVPGDHWACSPRHAGCVQK